MTKLRAECSSLIGAPAARVYGILADYRDAHQRILPREFFTSIIVEKGGYGAGTELKVTGRMLGMSRTLRMTAAEPEPGRILTESDLESGLVTAFIVNPRGAESCEVTIRTLWTAQPGLAGLMERLVVPGIFRRIYRRELELLAMVATEVSGGTSSRVQPPGPKVSKG